MPSGRPRYPGLTPREQEVLGLIGQGLTNRQIADRLGVSLDGAKYHVSQILMKLDVTTREEAIARTMKRRTLGLTGIGAALKKLTMGSVMKMTAVAVLFAAVVLMALVAIGLYVTRTQFKSAEQAAGPHVLPLTIAGEPPPFLRLLEHTPATDDSTLYFSDYAALREYLGVQPPSQDAPASEITAYWASLSEAGMYQNPISDSFTTGATALNSELGLNIANLDQSLHVWPGQNDCGPDTILEGRFDEARIDTALRRTSSFRDALTQTSHNGVSYFSWYDGCNRQTGGAGPGRLVLQDDLVYWSAESTAALEGMIDTSSGATATLAAARPYQLIAQAFADLGVFTAYAEVHSDPLWFEPARRIAEEEYGRNGPNVVEEQGYLRPYSAFAIGAGHDGQGTYAILIFVHANEEDAAANQVILQTRVDSGTRYRGRPWSDTITRSDIEVKGTVVEAKLWAPDPKFLLQSWRDLDSLFVSKP